MTDGRGGNRNEHHDPVLAYESAKLGIWLFLASEVMLFGALFAAYTIFRLKHPEVFHEGSMKLNKPLGTINTVVLICSSLTVALGIAAIRQGKQKLLGTLYTATVLLACIFLGIKYVEYTEKFHHGIYPGTDIFFSLYFSLTALHSLHILAGMAVMIVIILMARKGRFTAESHGPVEFVGIYWHFVDLVWIYLFPLLYLIG